MRNRRASQRLMAEMNVVPYIDVTLVLLIIFMITAPLITQGVKVDLPKVASEVIPPSDNEPIIVSVDEQGAFYIDYGESPNQAIDAETLRARVATVLKYQPRAIFLLKGDQNVPYGRVVDAMSLLQSAGIGSVGLITQSPEQQLER